jgi:hypothetical protein
MGILLILTTTQIISLILLIAMVGVIIFALIMSPKWRKADEEREKNAPDLCKKGDYLIGKTVKYSWYSDMRGWVISEYDADVKGTVEEYNRSVNCVKLNKEWYIIGDMIGGLVVSKIIPM